VLEGKCCDTPHSFEQLKNPACLAQQSGESPKKNTTEIVLILHLSPLLRANTKPGKPSNKKPLIFKGLLHCTGL
jgi:hypothetical protein